MSIRLSDDDKQNSILNAALSVFGRYGFKRTSMEDIAREADISRAALYLRFENKAAIFVALALGMGEQACLAAETAWPETLPFEVGLAASACALHVPFWKIIQEMPHGRELVEADDKTVGEVLAAINARFGALIASRAGGLLCSASHGDREAFATMVVAGLSGIKANAQSQDALVASITSFARLVWLGGRS
jgi:AcrR family transcriptional regulator